MEQRIHKWAAERGLFRHSDPGKQFLKLVEELGELSQGLQRHDKAAIKDAIGDMTVVLTVMAKQFGWSLQDDILPEVVDIIESRKGEVKNGVFVKRASD